MLIDDQAVAKGNAGDATSMYEDDDEPSRDVCEALEAISLTCRAFTPSAQKALLASIAIDLETQVLTDLVKCFAKKPELCTYVSKLTLLASIEVESPLRPVKGLQAVLQQFDLDTVTVEADPDIGASWADAGTAPFIAQLLEGLRFKHLYMRDFECAHTVLLPNKTVQSLTLDFSTISEGSFAEQDMDHEDDFYSGYGEKKKQNKKQGPKKEKALSCKILYIKNLVCAQLHPDPDFGSLRSRPDSVDYLEVELDYLEEGQEGALDMASYEEAKMLKEFFKQPLGRPTRIHFENCRLSDLALQAIFDSPLLQETTSLHLHNVVQCATDSEFGEMRPFSLSKLAKLTELYIGAVDKDLFAGCPPNLEKLSMLYINASLGVLQRLLKLESRMHKLGHGKRRTKTKSKAFPECGVEISANVCSAFADGPVNTISLERLSSPYVGRYLSLLDVQLSELGHTDYGQDCIDAAEEAINCGPAGGSQTKQKGRKPSVLPFLWPRYEDEFGGGPSRGWNDSGWKAGKLDYFGDETDYSDSVDDAAGISYRRY